MDFLKITMYMSYNAFLIYNNVLKYVHIGIYIIWL